MMFVFPLNSFHTKKNGNNKNIEMGEFKVDLRSIAT